MQIDRVTHGIGTVTLVFGAVFQLFGCGLEDHELETLVRGPDITQSTEMSLNEADIVATFGDDHVVVRFPIQRAGPFELDVTFDVALRDLEGELIGEVSRDITLMDSLNEVVIPINGLDSELETGELASYVIHYHVYTVGSTIQGRRSFYDAVEKRSIHLLSSDTFFDGQATYVRIVATEPVTGRPLSGASVDVYLNDDESENLVFSGQTDEFGTLSATVQADEALLGSRTLHVVIDSELGIEEIDRPVQVERAERVLITTDKPLYQPGQTIHIRTLSLRRGDLLPAANRPITIEVLDGRGNKILREDVETDEFGIASTQLRLARELNMGEFIIRAVLGDITYERTVTVDRYSLPRFSASVTPDASYYLPGQEADILVQADYLFGEPVAGGILHADIYQHDYSDTLLTQIDAELDENGTYLITVEIPSAFAGPTLQQGNVTIQAFVTITDGAGEEHQASATLPVAETGIYTMALPGHDIIPGRDNIFHVLTSDPNGQPVSADCSAVLDGGNLLSFRTEDEGVVTVVLAVPEGEDTFWFDLGCVDALGASAQDMYAFDLTHQTDGGAIAVITDASLYRAGDMSEVTVLANSPIERVFLDIIANNRTLSTTEVAIENGVGVESVVLPLDITGAVEFLAYDFGANGQLIRGQRLVYVEAANELSIEFTADHDEYLPGEDAVIDVDVTDSNGVGVTAAIGLQIVDEAVFALQDMRPGTERIFFQLEQEVLAPRYDVQGYNIEEVVNSGDIPRLERERAAEILFAASQGSPGYGIVVDTLAEQRTIAGAIVSDHFRTDIGNVLEDAWKVVFDQYGGDYTAIYADAEAIILALNDRHIDPWGQYYLFEPQTNWGDTPDSFLMSGAGPDEIFGTDDDVQALTWLDQFVNGHGQTSGADPDDLNNQPAPGVDMAADGNGDGWDEEPQAAERDDDAAGGYAGADPPRVRSYFPETLLVEPALITDGAGHASLNLSMADSITTWRITGMANSQSGALGSSTAGIRVFQPFFLDIDFPPTLTQNDEIEVPVAVFNFLDEPQDIRLQVENVGESWYDLLSSPIVDISLDAGEVTSVPFRVRVRRVGFHGFQVSGLGGDFPDAVVRTVEVTPDGEEVVLSVSSRLEADVSEIFSVPGSAIENASSLIVKIYPGMFSQVVEGLEALLGHPSGCFEQTSSTTYPNVLALQYMIETEQVTPEIQTTASDYIQTGYQRLLSYEVTGGGFEWFGNAPAHRILTAYGLLEFSDMSEVYKIDLAVIERTQNWLLAQQESDGRFRAAQEGIHEGATNNFRDSDLRATAYIGFALVESGYTGPEIDRAVDYLAGQLDTIDDSYTLALVANMLISNDRSDSHIPALLERLNDARQESGETYYWTSDSQSLTYGSGGGMVMETSALVLYAFLRAGVYPQSVDGGVTYLVENKDTFGTWSTTQATILSLRTFIAQLNGTTQPANATVGVSLNGELVQTFEFDEDNSDVVRQLDLRELLQTGDNRVDIDFEGEGSLLYQIVGRYYLPWDDVETPAPDLAIEVTYPETTIEVGQPATVNVRVTNLLDIRAEMVMVQVGVPPGFDVDMRTVQNHVASGIFSRADRTAEGLDAYLYGIDAGESIEFDFDIIPRMPMTVQTPGSTAYLYYAPDVRAACDPSTVTVQ